MKSLEGDIRPAIDSAAATLWRRYFAVATLRYGVMAVLLLVSGAYLALKSVFSHDHEIDFKYFWFAGKLWNEGVDPYSEAYVARAASYFTNTNVIDWWVYPPNWWIVSAPLALLDIEHSLVVWRTLSAVFAIGGCWLLFRSARLLNPSIPIEFGVLLFFVTATLQATPMGLALGQSSLLLYFGMCLLIYGMAAQQRVLQIIALIILMLKPHVGIVVYAALIVLPQWRKSVVAAVIAGAVLSIPAIVVSGGLWSFVQLYLGELAEYGTKPVNGPAGTTGVRHLVYYLTGVEVSSFLTIGFGAVCAMAFVYVLSQRRAEFESEADFNVSIALMIVVTALATVSLHSYDFVLAVPLLLFYIKRRTLLPLALSAFGFLVIYRATNVADVTGLYDQASDVFSGSRLETIAMTIIFASFIYAHFSRSVATEKFEQATPPTTP